jgi:hypothetical protein
VWVFDNGPIIPCFRPLTEGWTRIRFGVTESRPGRNQVAQRRFWA